MSTSAARRCQTEPGRGHDLAGVGAVTQPWPISSHGASDRPAATSKGTTRRTVAGAHCRTVRPQLGPSPGPASSSVQSPSEQDAPAGPEPHGERAASSAASATRSAPVALGARNDSEEDEVAEQVAAQLVERAGVAGRTRGPRHRVHSVQHPDDALGGRHHGERAHAVLDQSTEDRAPGRGSLSALLVPTRVGRSHAAPQPVAEEPVRGDRAVARWREHRGLEVGDHVVVERPRLHDDAQRPLEADRAGAQPLAQHSVPSGRRRQLQPARDL